MDINDRDMSPTHNTMACADDNVHPVHVTELFNPGKFQNNQAGVLKAGKPLDMKVAPSMDLTLQRQSLGLRCLPNKCPPVEVSPNSMHLEMDCGRETRQNAASRWVMACNPENPAF